MSISTIVRGLIINQVPITSIIPADRWKSSGSLEEDNAPDRPFAVIRYGVVSVGMAHIKRGQVTFWIHDELGTYATINNVLDLLYARLHGQEHVADADGNEIIEMKWNSASGDLYDPGFRTLTRNTTFDIVGKGV